MSGSMTILKIYQRISAIHTELDWTYVSGQPIPNDLILEHNKLLNDYNEQLKSESNGK